MQPCVLWLSSEVYQVEFSHGKEDATLQTISLLSSSNDDTAPFYNTLKIRCPHTSGTWPCFLAPLFAHTLVCYARTGLFGMFTDNRHLPGWLMVMCAVKQVVRAIRGKLFVLFNHIPS